MTGGEAHAPSPLPRVPSNSRVGLIQAKMTSQLAWLFIMREMIIFILTLLCKFTVVLSRPWFMSRPLVSKSQLLLLSLRKGQLGNHDAYRRIQLRTSAQCPGGLSSLLQTLVTWPGPLGPASLLLGDSPELWPLLHGGH